MRRATFLLAILTMAVPLAAQEFVRPGQRGAMVHVGSDKAPARVLPSDTLMVVGSAGERIEVKGVTPLGAEWRGQVLRSRTVTVGKVPVWAVRLDLGPEAPLAVHDIAVAIRPAGVTNRTDGAPARLLTGDSVQVVSLVGDRLMMVRGYGVDAPRDGLTRVPTGHWGGRVIKRFFRRVGSDPLWASKREARTLEGAERVRDTFFESTPDLVLYELYPTTEYVATDITLEWGQHDPDETVKYLRLWVIPYNAVGDRLTDTFGKSEAELSLTGPVDASMSAWRASWSNVWFDIYATCLRVRKVRVEHMDGSRYTYIRELPLILEGGFENSCSVEAQERRRERRMERFRSRL